ncbi:MAG TPA: PilZ domain-containing protein [Kofleriaceae bacterium]|nr:PilZ domain-containing protein [Kofleriaceae bacterium]
MTDRSSTQERRRTPRITAKGTVVFRAGDHEQAGRLSNLSEGGVFVVTTTTAPTRLLGRTVDLELRLDTGHAEWLRATGKIARIRPDGVAIVFDTLAAPLLRMLDELTTASRAHARIISVVLIDADPVRRALMAGGFRAIGCAVIEAATPLEAIVRLGESSFEPDVIAVADSDPTANADQMRAFVERDHPDARLVRIGDELLQPEGIASWLSSTELGISLPTRVREVLVTPRRRP